MFTGIVSAIGTIREARQQCDLRVVISSPYDPAQIAIGASIACSGVCLTVVERGVLRPAQDDRGAEGWFAADVSGETLACTVPGMWAQGARLNLETALKLGDELGGHIVTGHVDGVGTVHSTDQAGDSWRVVIAAPADLAPYLAAKGSVTVQGVSLTVNQVADQADGTCQFALNLIPHTGEVTTLGALKVGDQVNLEIDVLARYLMRMQSLRGNA